MPSLLEKIAAISVACLVSATAAFAAGAGDGTRKIGDGGLQLYHRRGELLHVRGG